MQSSIRPGPVHVAVLLAGAALAPFASVHAQSSIHAEVVAENIDFPTALVGSPLDPDVLFVVQQDGVVRKLDHGVFDPVPFLDLTSKVYLAAMTGMVNMAFDPDYAHNGWVYLDYSTSSKDFTVVRYRVPVPSSYVVDLSSEQELISVSDVISFHVGGGIDFSADGKLLVAFGDRRVELPGGGCTAQDGSVLIGKVVRLERDGSIPADNPYVGVPGIRDEIFAWGLRQPVRLSVDPPTGDIWITEVGEALREEVVRIAGNSSGGENFGWRVMEGELCTPTTECTGICPNPAMEAPVLQLDHTQACSVMGGHVYRGSEIPELQGRFLFTDWCHGHIWSFVLSGGEATDLKDHTAELLVHEDVPLTKVTHIGRDAAGELYIVDAGAQGGIPGFGRIAKIVPDGPLAADVTQVSVSAGGTQKWKLDAPEFLSSTFYMVLGSASGTLPGLSVGNGWTLPLNWDAYHLHTIQYPNLLPLAGSFGALDVNAEASASFSLPPGSSPALIGHRLDHAFVTFGPWLTVSFTSNPVSVDLVL